MTWGFDTKAPNHGVPAEVSDPRFVDVPRGTMVTEDTRITDQMLKCLRGEHEADCMELRIIQLNENERYGDMYGVKVALCIHCGCVYVEKV